MEHTVIPDRIEAGTFMIAAAMAGGDVLISNVLTEHLKPLLAKLNEVGVKVIKEIDSVSRSSFYMYRSSHSLQFSDMHKTVFKDRFRYPAGSVPDRKKRHKLRLQIGRKTRIR